MAKEDLFDEDAEGMARMTFGEHLEDLRRRLILALFGFVPGVIIGLCIGRLLVKVMSDPVVSEIESFYEARAKKRQVEFDKKMKAGEKLATVKLRLQLPVAEFRRIVREAIPEVQIPEDGAEGGDPPPTQKPASGGPSAAKAKDNGEPPQREEKHVTIEAKLYREQLELDSAPKMYPGSGLITLGPQESFMAWMKVSIIAGLVISSPWVVYHLWMFVAEGLYRHERKIVYRAMPTSIGLFLFGVLFCFVVVLPVVIRFFFSFNARMDIDPNIRLNEWLGFATILPVIFGLCFELPLVMLVLERVGIFTYDTYVSKWRHAILAISIIAMVVTPTTDPGSKMLLMGPMTALYGLGLWLVRARHLKDLGFASLNTEAKLKAFVVIIAITYFVGVAIQFLLFSYWVSPDWWFETVWKPSTFPTSWLLGRVQELSAKDSGWIWCISLLNACILGVALLRVGEAAVAVVRKFSDWNSRRSRGG